jgi:hypothetical protein
MITSNVRSPFRLSSVPTNLFRELWSRNEVRPAVCELDKLRAGAQGQHVPVLELVQAARWARDERDLLDSERDNEVEGVEMGPFTL